MLQATLKYCAIVLMFLMYAEVATAKRICPQNDITSSGKARTFPGFQDLFGNVGDKLPDNPLDYIKNVYADECNLIEELDNGSILTSDTPKDNPNNKFFFGLLWNLPNILFHKHTTTQAPPAFSTTPKPITTTKPYWSGGIFGNNPVAPLIPLTPSDEIKPVYELEEEIVEPAAPSHGELLIGFSFTKPTLPPKQTASSAEIARFSSTKPTASTSDAAPTTITPTTKNSRYLTYTSPKNILRSYFRFLFT